MTGDPAAALPFERPLGARPVGADEAEFRVWAPNAERVAVRLRGTEHPLVDAGLGVWEGRLRAAAGNDYLIVLDGTAWPDPCSRAQPEGVRGPSRIVDPSAHAWSDTGWSGPDPARLVVYEAHVGTLTPEGTFDGAIARLGALAELGFTAIELLPVATFPGRRNWGYDGLYAWAPADAYGGPEGLRRLVDAAHATGLAVILDVVYNHVGPGNEALSAFGPYFSGRYGTPWGDAMNYDDRDSGAVREWAVQNACMWIGEYHVDGLRLDAVHAIYDTGPRPLLAELTGRARATAGGRTVALHAESDANDPALVRPAEAHGMGFDGVWADDFHHSLHALLTGERTGYYADYGSVGDLARAFTTPFVFSGDYSPFRGKRHGAPVEDPRPGGYVVCAQNHDQVGNRALGDRLPPREARLGALCVLASPWTPLVFMGEEHGERRPFQFFTDHIDPAIADATREGRRREHAHEVDPALIPDPQDPATLARSVLEPEAGDPAVRDMFARALAARRDLPPGPATSARADEGARTLVVRRGAYELHASFADAPRTIETATTEIVAETGGASLSGGRLELPPMSGALTR
jgi:maltooligosyltrehalose trehalohydrolase